MATITVSTDSNFDDIANQAFVNGDTLSIDSNATLTVNSDSRWGQNGAVLGPITIATASGGKFSVDGTQTWWLPFDTFSGNHHLALSYAQSEDASPSSFVDLTAAINNTTANDVSPYPEATPAVNDNMYFGYSSKFNKLWVNVGTVGVGTYTLTWEYYNGASWVALSNAVNGIVDFKTAGWTSVLFTPAANWTTVAVNGQTYYWIRARISSYTSMTTKPLLTMARIDVLGFTLSTSSGSGEVLGVWSALGTSPLDPSSTSATGFIKLRSKTNSFSDNQAISINSIAYGNSLVNSSVGGSRGWLNIVQLDGNASAGAATTIPRLGTYQVRGDYFILGVTNGSNDQTFQYYVADYCPMIEVETGVGTGIYEVWSEAGDRWATATATIATDVRGKFFSCTSAGVIEIANTTTATNGYKPVSGCTVRVPNIHFSGAFSTAYQTNVAPNATVANRPNFVTTSAGVVDIQIANYSDMYFNLTQPYSVILKHVGIFGPTIFTEMASACDFDYVSISYYGSQDLVASTGIMNFYTNFAGGSIANSRFVKHDISATGEYVTTLTNIAGFTFTNCYFHACTSSTTVLTRGHATSGVINGTNLSNCNFIGTIAVGSRILLTTGSNVKFTNTYYADIAIGVTSSTTPVYVFDLATKCNNITIDGVYAFGNIANVNPYTGIVNITSCDYVRVRNIGTYASPYVCSATNGAGTIVNIGTVCSNLKFQRLYVRNVRTAPLIFADNTSRNVLIEHVHPDYADTFTPLVLNGLLKGCGGLNSTTNQTAVYGTHFMDLHTSTTAGRLVIIGNEKTTGSEYTKSTNAKFNSAGGLQMPLTTSEIIWTWSHYIIGHTAFAISAPTLTGTNPNNFDLYYQLDNGNGFSSLATTHRSRTTNVSTITTTTVHDLIVGQEIVISNLGDSSYNGTFKVISIPSTTSFTINNSGGDESTTADSGGVIIPYFNLSYKKTATGGANGAFTITMSSTIGCCVGDYVFGTSVGVGAKITELTNSTTITVNVANTGTVSGVLTFNHAPSDTITSAVTGFKLKVKGNINTGSATNNLQYFRIDTVSNTTTQAYVYPLDVDPVTITIVDSAVQPIEGARVRVTASETAGGWTKGDVLFTGLTDVAGKITANVATTANVGVSIRVRKSTTGTLYKPSDNPNTIVNGTGLSASIVMIPDV